MTQRDYIIERTTQMFVNQGIKSVRMDDVAQTLGVSKRTLYEMFGDKEELIYLCMSKYLRDQHKSVLDISKYTQNKLEAVLVGFIEMTQYSENNNRLMSNLMRFYPSVFERLHSDVNGDGTRRLRQSIQECVDEGLLDGNFNIDLAITLLYYTAMGVVVRRDVAFPAGVSVRDAFMHVVICFFRGIATEKGLHVIDEFFRSNKFRELEIQISKK